MIIREGYQVQRAQAGRNPTASPCQRVADSQWDCFKFNPLPQMTGAVTTLLKPHIFRFHPTVSHQASLSGSHTTGKPTVQSSHPQPCPLSPDILSYSPASWLPTPFTWLFGPDVLHSGYPLTSLLSLDSDLALADEPSRTWLLTTFLFLLDAAPLCITLPSPVSTFSTKLYLRALTHAGPSAQCAFPLFTENKESQ